MMILGPIGFAAPWLLLALIALPILWILLRAVPPAPIRRRFPGVALLLGLTDDETQSDRTPWWLLLLRLLAVAAVIIGFAGPVLNPQQARDGEGDLVIVLDGSWAGARTWAAKINRVETLLTEAAVANRRVAIVNLTDLPNEDLPFAAPTDWQNRLPNLAPKPWQPANPQAYFSGQSGSFETYWISDGLDYDGRDDLLTTLETFGPVTAFQSPRQTIGLRPARFEDGQVLVSATRTPGPPGLARLRNGDQRYGLLVFVQNVNRLSLTRLSNQVFKLLLGRCRNRHGPAPGIAQPDHPL